jgi:electron transfer flavoprotein alpha subunit
MDFAVLVKVVPDVERLRYDLDRKTLVRTGVASYLNPNDARAVRIAVRLRRPGERVTVVSMGLPEAEGPLRETFAFGADRVVLLTDPALAGSDTLVTARVLHRSLHTVGHDLVLAGEKSIDSETGQIGPEVAALLGVPVVTSVRSLTRNADGAGLEAIAETGTGWSRLRCATPAVVTVNERILRKAGKPTPADLARSQQMTVETPSVSDLGLPPRSLGLEGSPTFVRTVEDEEPRRHARIFAGGEIATQVDDAARMVEELLRSPAVRPAPPPRLPASLADDREVLVLVSGSSGETDPSSLGALSELRRWGSHVWPSAVWVGREPSEADRVRVARAGAARGYLVPTVNPYVGSATAARAIDTLLTSRPALAGVIFLADSFGREVGGQLAAHRGLGLTGDAVGFSVDASGELTWRKPAFGGGLVASIRTRTRPSLATVRPGSFARSEDPGTSPVPVERLTGVTAGPDPELLEHREEYDPRWGELGSARVVLIAGMGLGGPGNLPALFPTLSAWKAALGATRRVVDEGWLPGGQQVGLTGTSVAADLAVLIGVSGAGNHMIGLRRTRVLLAVNPDPSAPVFRRVDVGIVNGWSEVLPELTRRLAPLAQARAVAVG